jgi:hypothetical protein
VDNWIYVKSAAATLPQLRRIKANSSSATSFYTVSLRDPLRPNSPQDQDVFDNVPLNTEICSIIRPYHVIVCTASTVPVGVALGTVTAGNYTIVQVAGLAILDNIGTGNVTVVNQPAIPTAAGQVKGSAAGAANLYTGAGLILPQMASTAVASVLLPAFVNFTGQ